jgi:hypothetical protein
VLPELQNLYLTDKCWRDELEEQDIELFIPAGQNADHSVTVHRLPYCIVTAVIVNRSSDRHLLPRHT